MTNRGWLALVVLSACACPPVVHDETTYANPAMEDVISRCANEKSCLALCSRAFMLDIASIDSCRIVALDGSGGATVAVTYHEYVCQSDDSWSVGDDLGFGGDDPCSDGSCDPPADDPCSDGSCDPPPDDPPPDDPPPDDPPPDDPPPDQM